MNLPNKITIFRMCMIPFFLVFFLIDTIPYNNWIALAIFVIAAASDAVDGYLARKYNLVTNFGKFMDPMADKLLCCSALVCLCAKGEVPAWIVLIIIGREFAISGIRQIAADNGVAIAASNWGKAKTIAQMAMIIVMLFQMSFASLTLNGLAAIIMYCALSLTVISLIDYIVKNKKVLTINE